MEEEGYVIAAYPIFLFLQNTVMKDSDTQDIGAMLEVTHLPGTSTSQDSVQPLTRTPDALQQATSPLLCRASPALAFSSVTLTRSNRGTRQFHTCCLRLC